MALAARALELVLVDGTTYYVALGTAADELAGTFTELTTAGYARKAHSAWLTSVTSEATERRNNGAIVFDAVDVDALAVSHWAIYDAATLGHLLVVGHLRNTSGVIEPQNLAAGDQMRFDDQMLRVLATPEAAG